MSKIHAFGHINYADFVTEEERERDRQHNEFMNKLHDRMYAPPKYSSNRLWESLSVIWFLVFISVVAVPQLWVKLFCWLSTIGVG